MHSSVMEEFAWSIHLVIDKRGTKIKSTVSTAETTEAWQPTAQFILSTT